MLIKNRSLLFAFLVQQLLLLTNVISISIPGEFVGSRQEADEASSLNYDRYGTISDIRKDIRYAKERIFNGISARPGQFPSFVRLFIFKKTLNSTMGFGCGGTILNDRQILTAAHCTNGSDYIDVIVNPFNKHQYYSKYRSEKICTSSKFNSTSKPFYMEHDVAIIKVRKPIQFNDFVKPACLPTTDLLIGNETATVGLGATYLNKTDPKQSTPPEIPQTIFIKRVDCGTHRAFHKGDYCMRSSRRERLGKICSGDSGGPMLTCSDNCHIVHGVASTTSGGCEIGYGASIDSTFASTFRLRDEIQLLRDQCS